MDIQAVIKVLNKELDASITSDYYNMIEEWRQWWAGYVKSFHKFSETTDTGKKKERTLYSLKMAKKICEDWAACLLNEKTRIVLADKASSEFLQGVEEEQSTGGVFGNISFWDEANSLVEKAFYSGTGAFVMKLDGLMAGEGGAVLTSPEAKVRMEYLPAMNIIPITVRYHQITEVAFASENTVRGQKYVYVEIHTLENGVYVIQNRYFKSVGGVLSAAPLPEGIAERINTGSPYPFFAILHPNCVNPYPDNLGLGCSIFSQAVDNLKGVDIAYNNFNRDLWLGGKKVFYNRELTKTIGVDKDGEPIYLAPDDMLQQLFVSVGDEFTEDKKLVHEFNPDLRVADNRDAVQAQLDYLSFKCGMGTRHYRFSGSMGASPITATQYTGEKQELKQNAAKHSIVIEQALQSIVRAILWAGKNILGQPVDPETAIVVIFSDGYIVSDDEKKAEDRQDIISGIMQRYEYRMRWYGEDEVTARAKTQPPGPVYGGRSFPPGEDE